MDDKRMELDQRILDGVQSQISAFDSKAGILISVIGIVFALSLSMLDVFPNLTNVTIQYVVLAVTYGLSLLCELAAIFCSIMVVFPRSHKEIKPCNVNYYMDLSQMDYEAFKTAKSNFFSREETIFRQIETNAKIAKRKHYWLKASIICLIPLAITLITSIIMALVFLKTHSTLEESMPAFRVNSAQNHY